MAWRFPEASVTGIIRSKQRRTFGPAGKHPVRLSSACPAACRGAWLGRLPGGQGRAFLLVLAVLTVTGLWPRTVHPFALAPFSSRNQNPLVQIYGLPAAGSAVVAPQGQGEFRATLDHASNYVDRGSSREQLVLDGETTRLTLGGRYGLSRKVEIGVEVPYVYHGGGFLDGFLINYHDLFGFPQGGRDDAPRDRLLYRYRRDGVDRLNLASSGGGLGDIAVTAGLQLYHEADEQRAVALRASLKLPTGRSSSLFGSGSTDVALWVAADEGFALPLGSGALFGAAGVLVMAGGDVLREQRNDAVGFGSIGAGWKPLDWLALKLQVDAHTAFYRNSDFQPLADFSTQLLIGGTLGLSERTSLDIAVSEDLARKTAPDVVFHFNVITRF
ncbi:MAG: DUF3187 family protein [Syntrophales bacterium]